MMVHATIGDIVVIDNIGDVCQSQFIRVYDTYNNTYGFYENVYSGLLSIQIPIVNNTDLFVSLTTLKYPRFVIRTYPVLFNNSRRLNLVTLPSDAVLRKPNCSSNFTRNASIIPVPWKYSLETSYYEIDVMVNDTLIFPNMHTCECNQIRYYYNNKSYYLDDCYNKTLKLIDRRTDYKYLISFHDTLIPKMVISVHSNWSSKIPRFRIHKLPPNIWGNYKLLSCNSLAPRPRDDQKTIVLTWDCDLDNRYYEISTVIGNKIILTGFNNDCECQQIYYRSVEYTAPSTCVNSTIKIEVITSFTLTYPESLIPKMRISAYYSLPFNTPRVSRVFIPNPWGNFTLPDCNAP